MTKILLVEDDKSLREIYGVRLMAEGYEIASAGDGEEALAMAIKERPQLIVSDVMMPKISGFDMLDILRSTSETKGIKVIMMTALSSEDQRARGESLGADKYLVKSQVGIEDVVRAVHEILGDSQTQAPAQASSFGPAPASSGVTPVTTSPSQPRPAVSVSPRQPSASQPVINSSTSAPASTTSGALPQPTAPFSTPRPASLGDKIINPTSDPNPPKDIGAMMSQELSNSPSSPPQPAPDASSQIPPPPTTPQAPSA